MRSEGSHAFALNVGAEPRARGPMRVFEVAQITGYVNDLFRTDDVLSDLWLRGEVGDFKRAPSGHTYFSLLGEASLLRCVLFRGNAARCAVLPAPGEAIVLH